MDSLQALDEFVVVGVPDGASVFEDGSDVRLVGPVLHLLGVDLQGSTEEPQCPASLVGDGVDVGLPRRVC